MFLHGFLRFYNNFLRLFLQILITDQPNYQLINKITNKIVKNCNKTIVFINLTHIFCDFTQKNLSLNFFNRLKTIANF